MPALQSSPCPALHHRKSLFVGHQIAARRSNNNRQRAREGMCVRHSQKAGSPETAKIFDGVDKLSLMTSSFAEFSAINYSQARLRPLGRPGATRISISNERRSFPRAASSWRILPPEKNECCPFGGFRFFLGLALALLRMHRFAVLYARELFVQFLSVTNEKAVDWEPEK